MDWWIDDQEGEYGIVGEEPDLLFLDSPVNCCDPPISPDQALLHVKAAELQLAAAFVQDLNDFGGFQTVALAARSTASGANEDSFDASKLEVPEASRPTGASYQQHRPAPPRRPSNPPPSTLLDGPTPKNADDAEQTCDNRRLFWEQDANWKSPCPAPEPLPPLCAASACTGPKPVPLPCAGVSKPLARPPPFAESEKPVPLPSAGVTEPMPRPPPTGKKPTLTEASSFKQKKSPGCQIELEEGNDVHKLDDDRHTFDNFDRLWEKDPRFVGSCSGSSPTRAAAPELKIKTLAADRYKKVEAQDIIQKHTINLVNLVRSSTGKEEEPQQWCKSKLIYDPMTKSERRFIFELDYKVMNRNEDQGSADATIRNAALVIKCDVQVQVMLKTDPKRESERKFLYSFVHSIKVISDFKLESQARLLHNSDILVSTTTPEQFQEPGIDVMHHKVLHFLAILHSWAVASTPRQMRRMSASTSSSAAHRAVEGEAGAELMRAKEDEEEEDQKCDDAAGSVGKFVRNSRSGRRSHPYLQRSSSK